MGASATPAAQDISLAAWSFSGSFFQGRWKLLELPNILHEKLNIHALEHVDFVMKEGVVYKGSSRPDSR